MNRQWRLPATCGLAVLAVLVFAHWQGDTADPIEVFWACLGGVGGVYGAAVWWRRVQFSRWWHGQSRNGLMGLTVQSHVVLRGLGALSQLLILTSGLTAMTAPASVRRELQINDLVTTVCVIGLGVLSTLACWYAERVAERQVDFILRHPEE